MESLQQRRNAPVTPLLALRDDLTFSALPSVISLALHANGVIGACGARTYCGTLEIVAAVAGGKVRKGSAEVIVLP